MTDLLKIHQLVALKEGWSHKRYSKQAYIIAKYLTEIGPSQMVLPFYLPCRKSSFKCFQFIHTFAWYSLFTPEKACSPLTINRKQAILRVNRLKSHVTVKPSKAKWPTMSCILVRWISIDDLARRLGLTQNVHLAIIYLKTSDKLHDIGCFSLYQDDICPTAPFSWGSVLHELR